MTRMISLAMDALEATRVLQGGPEVAEVLLLVVSVHRSALLGESLNPEARQMGPFFFFGGGGWFEGNPKQHGCHWGGGEIGLCVFSCFEAKGTLSRSRAEKTRHAQGSIVWMTCLGLRSEARPRRQEPVF